MPLLNSLESQIELQFGQQDEAVIHFYQTAQYLQKSIMAARERRETHKVELYKSLRDAVANAAIGEIYGAFIEVQARLIAPKKKRLSGTQAASTVAQPIETPTQAEPGSLPFDFPIQSDWPATVELSPMNMSITNQAALLPNQAADAIDYIELTEISINGKRYTVEPLYAISGNGGGMFRLYRDKEYVPVHIRAEEGKTELANSYLLVHETGTT